MILTLLQTPANAAGQAGGGWSMWIMLIAIFLVMWLTMIRPQRKQQKALEEMRKNMKKGDKVITNGGIYGVVDSIEETTVLIKVDGDVKLRVDKACLQVVAVQNAEKK